MLRWRDLRWTSTCWGVSNTVENLEHIVRACATVEVDADGVEFDPQSVRGEVIVKGKAYEGIRTRLRGALGKIK
jgi:diketogulonate reductase-like aldo/keto reductase